MVYNFVTLWLPGVWAQPCCNRGKGRGCASIPFFVGMPCASRPSGCNHFLTEIMLHLWYVNSILFIVLMALSCNSHYEGQSSFLKSKVSVFIISPFLLGDALIVSAVNSIWAKQITKCELRQVSSYSKLSTFELRLKLNWVEQWVNSSLIEAVCTRRVHVWMNV